MEFSVPVLSTIVDFSVGGVHVCIVCVPELSTMVEFGDEDSYVQSWNVVVVLLYRITIAAPQQNHSDHVT